MDAQQEQDEAILRMGKLNPEGMKDLIEKADRDSALDTSRPACIVTQVMEKHGLTEREAVEMIEAFGG
jgi:hypothetical protein